MINFKHLHYFWVAAKQGGVVRASEILHITPQTISGQINLLEEQLGEALFRKAGRKLELTETGRVVLSYADEIFALSDELEASIRTAITNRTPLIRIGISDAVPKSIAYRLLAPALTGEERVRFQCRENSLASLLGELALHRLDLVIADGPMPEGLGVRGYNHPLGDCGICFLATAELAQTLRDEFPVCLTGAPILMPSNSSLLHANLMQWLDNHHIYPNIVGEFDDSALMKAFGQAGTGIFIVPSAISAEVEKQYQVQRIGQTEKIRARFFAISTERRISNPAVAAINAAARDWLNSPD